MRILFDHNLPRRFREHVPEHDVRTAREMKWEQLRNGALLSAASEAGFDAFLTIDKQLEHQQNWRRLLYQLSSLMESRTRCQRFFRLRHSFTTSWRCRLTARCTSCRKADMYFG